MGLVPELSLLCGTVRLILRGSAAPPLLSLRTGACDSREWSGLARVRRRPSGVPARGLDEYTAESSSDSDSLREPPPLPTLFLLPTGESTTS